MKKIKVLLLTFALILLAGCGKSLTNKSTGDTMKISLDVDTSSNYVWSYSIMDSNVIDLKSEEFLTPADDETLDGDAQVLTFKAFNEGESEIILSYMNNDSGKTKYDITLPRSRGDSGVLYLQSAIAGVNASYAGCARIV